MLDASGGAPIAWPCAPALPVPAMKDNQRKRRQLEMPGHDFFHPDCLSQSSLAGRRRYHGGIGGNSASSEH